LRRIGVVGAVAADVALWVALMFCVERGWVRFDVA